MSRSYMVVLVLTHVMELILFISSFHNIELFEYKEA